MKNHIKFPGIPLLPNMASPSTQIVKFKKFSHFYSKIGTKQKPDSDTNNKHKSLIEIKQINI